MLRSLLFTVMLTVVTLASARAAPEQWTSQRDPQLGFSFSYPETMFSQLQGERPSFHYFASPHYLSASSRPTSPISAFSEAFPE